MLADERILNKIIGLSRWLGELTGKRCFEIMKALLATRTLHDLGCDGDGRLTQEPAVACAKLLERWIKQAKERNRR